MGRENRRALKGLELPRYAALKVLGVNSWHYRYLAEDGGSTGKSGKRGLRWLSRAVCALGCVGGAVLGLAGAGSIGWGVAGACFALGIVSDVLFKPRAASANEMKLGQDLRRIFERIEDHNRLVKRLKVLEKLKAAGNDVDMSHRDSALDVLRENREAYVKGLKTIRILAKSGESLDDLSDIQAILNVSPLAVNAEVADYAGIVDASLAGHVRVRESMKEPADDAATTSEVRRVVEE